MSIILSILLISMSLASDIYTGGKITLKYEVVKEKDYTDFSNLGLKATETSNTLAKMTPALMSASASLLLLPVNVFASSADKTFGNVHSAVMNMFDAGVVLVIIFAGAAWGLGHRSKAMEILIGVCAGYVLARHAVDIRDFLKNI